MRDFTLNTTVPEPAVPMGKAENDGNVYVSEEWRQEWFENVSQVLFGDGSEDILLDVPQGSFVGSIQGDEARGVIVNGDPGPGFTPTITLSRNLVADGSKLDGIAPGATANSTDAQLRNRSTHTGSQDISTVTGLQAELSGKVDRTTIAPANTTHLTADVAALDALGVKLNEIIAALS